MKKAKNQFKVYDHRAQGYELFPLIDEKYRVNAQTLSSCKLIRIPKENFFHMLTEHPHENGKFRYI